jgi:hypothetical protein
MTETDQVVSALTKSVHDLDASRRVGWAKMFSAVERLDVAERDRSIAKEDRQLFCQRLSYLYGFFERYLEWLGEPGKIASRELHMALSRVSSEPIRSVLDSTEMRHGREHAERVADSYPADQVYEAFHPLAVQKVKRSIKREKRKAKTNVLLDSPGYQEIRRAVLDELISESGLTNESEMRSRLKQQPYFDPGMRIYTWGQLRRAAKMLKAAMGRKDRFGVEDLVRLVAQELRMTLNEGIGGEGSGRTDGSPGREGIGSAGTERDR